MTDETRWQDLTLVAFDTETTGKYPLESELCEVAAVKWKGGKVIEEFQSLVKPTQKMTDTVIKIHNITNEMVADAPPIADVIPQFYDFIQESILVAHHSPFDLGFLAIELEQANLALPKLPVLCSSLLSRNLIPESPNHRLQTLIQFLKLPKGQAHRALDDATACLHLALKCFERMPEDANLKDLIKKQGKELFWKNYSMEEFRGNQVLSKIVKAIESKDKIDIVYKGGSNPGKARTVNPIGFVRNPTGDFLVARAEGDEHTKRYFVNKISDAQS